MFERPGNGLAVDATCMKGGGILDRKKCRICSNGCTKRSVYSSNVVFTIFDIFVSMELGFLYLENGA
jgi:hypothetical protein